MHVEPLAHVGSAPEVLRALTAATRRLHLPPPAALTGEWFGSRAVIAPSVDVRPVPPVSAFEPGGEHGWVAHDVARGSVDGIVGGGWIGYLSYPDAGSDGGAARIPEAAGGWTDCVLRQDLGGRWWYESLCAAELPRWIADALSRPAAPTPHHVDWTPPDRFAHRRGVLACLEAIRNGEVYQACVCTRFTGELDGSPVELFADAVARTSPARAAFVSGDWGAVASLSPELFLSRRGADVTSSPIKGTLPLTEPPARLRSSAKDVAENVMIVDLVRNDLGRVAYTGSVTVPELLSVRRAPGVWHLVSTVAARVDPGMPMAAILDATFPPASVTGTPKGRARELLSGWEPTRRGIYCGTVGFASPVAGCELNVAIRTVEVGASGSVTLGVGGGITADSDPDREWEECLHKAAAVVGSDLVDSLIAGAQHGVVQLAP